MDFGLSEEQRAIQEAARAFSDAELAPNAARWDEEKHFPVDVLRQAAALGLAAIYVREDVGGSGLGRVEAALVFEALARGCVSTAAFLSIHNMCGWMVDSYGSDDLRRTWLPRSGSVAMSSSMRCCGPLVSRRSSLVVTPKMPYRSGRRRRFNVG